MNSRPLFIPTILGTVRKGRASENVSKFVFEQVKRREGVESELIDIGELNFPGDDAAFGGAVQEAHTCPECGRTALRSA